VQSVGQEKRANISFTVPRKDLAKSVKLLTDSAQSLKCPAPTSCPSVAKLSVFGVGMKTHTSLASRMFQSLSAEGINVDMISTSEVCVNVVVDGQHGQKALAALKKEFADAMI
jgi:aspartate kinase